MDSADRPIPAFRSRTWMPAGLAVTAAVVLGSVSASAQMLSPPVGVYIEAEGQAVFGASDAEAGMKLDDPFALTGSLVKLDEGNGWGGALTLGYSWANGWSSAVRYRKLKADDTGGPIDMALVFFVAGAESPLGLPYPTTSVKSDAEIVDLLLAKDITVPSGQLQLFGGLTYAGIERDMVISDDCPCDPFNMVFNSDFHGLGPKIGFRGGYPVSDRIRFVGGASAAALFGTSKFKSAIDDTFVPPFAFKADDDRVVAALDAEAGFAFAVGAGTLTLGYRVDAILGALDTDQRVTDLMIGFGFPAIGDRHTDFIEHGPFARFSLPLAGEVN
jgi:hypothetical protein